MRYAKATLNFAKEKGLSKEVNKDMLLIDNTISENADLQNMLNSPIIKSKAKRSVLIEIFGAKTNAVSTGLINLLIENNRLPILPLVAKEYTVIYDYLNGFEVAQITSAVPLSKKLEKRILKKLKDISGKNLSFNNIIDPSILGGFILRVGDKQFDSSVSSQLKNLLSDFEKNDYISKII